MQLSLNILKSIKLYSGNFPFWENQVDILSLFTLKTTETLNITYKTNLRRLKVREKDQLGTVGPRNSMMMSS